MIRIPGKGVRYGEIWFDEEPELPIPDILVCRQRSQPWPRGSHQEFITLLLDLGWDEEALFNSLGKTHRYQIRRAATQDDGAFSVYYEPLAMLDDFCRFYNLFAAAKGLKPAYREWLNAAADSRRLILTCSRQNGDARVWHAYIHFGDRVRLYYSASLFRAEDRDLQGVIGRLNRWLHWQDILEFKRHGFQAYDLGGLFSDESSPVAAGINRFKEEFGGVRDRGFDCTAALTWKGHVYLNLLNLRERMRAIRAPA